MELDMSLVQDVAAAAMGAPDAQLRLSARIMEEIEKTMSDLFSVNAMNSIYETILNQLEHSSENAEKATQTMVDNINKFPTACVDKFGEPKDVFDIDNVRDETDGHLMGLKIKDGDEILGIANQDFNMIWQKQNMISIEKVEANMQEAMDVANSPITPDVIDEITPELLEEAEAYGGKESAELTQRGIEEAKSIAQKKVVPEGEHKIEARPKSEILKEQLEKEKEDLAKNGYSMDSKTEKTYLDQIKEAKREEGSLGSRSSYKQQIKDLREENLRLKNDLTEKLQNPMISNEDRKCAEKLSQNISDNNMKIANLNLEMPTVGQQIKFNLQDMGDSIQKTALGAWDKVKAAGLVALGVGNAAVKECKDIAMISKERDRSSAVDTISKLNQLEAKYHGAMAGINSFQEKTTERLANALENAFNRSNEITQSIANVGRTVAHGAKAQVNEAPALNSLQQGIMNKLNNFKNTFNEKTQTHARTHDNILDNLQKFLGKEVDRKTSLRNDLSQNMQDAKMRAAGANIVKTQHDKVVNTERLMR